MDNNGINARIKNAELKIGQILKRLEQETNQLVEDVELCCFEDGERFEETPIYLRHVIIKMRRLPGTNWA